MAIFEEVFLTISNQNILTANTVYTVFTSKNAAMSADVKLLLCSQRMFRHELFQGKPPTEHDSSDYNFVIATFPALHPVH